MYIHFSLLSRHSLLVKPNRAIVVSHYLIQFNTLTISGYHRFFICLFFAACFFCFSLSLPLDLLLHLLAVLTWLPVKVVPFGYALPSTMACTFSHTFTHSYTLLPTFVREVICPQQPDALSHVVWISPSVLCHVIQVTSTICFLTRLWHSSLTTERVLTQIFKSQRSGHVWINVLKLIWIIDLVTVAFWEFI